MIKMVLTAVIAVAAVGSAAAQTAPTVNFTQPLSFAEVAALRAQLSASPRTVATPRPAAIQDLVSSLFAARSEQCTMSPTSMTANGCDCSPTSSL